jgi:hypothetical protein
MSQEQAARNFKRFAWVSNPALCAEIWKDFEPWIPSLDFRLVVDLSTHSRSAIGLDAFGFRQFPGRVFFLS